MKALSLAIAVITVSLLIPVSAQNLDAELQRAVQKEMVSGDLKAAIEEYRRIAARAGDNRAVKAKALLQLADAHRRLGDLESGRLYEQIVKEFADQRHVASEARARLAAVRAPARAATGQAARRIWNGAEVDPMGAPSADGRILTYTDWFTGDLAVRDLTTGVNRHLTNTGGWQLSGDFAEFSAPSPDGRLVAYAWFTEKQPVDRHYDLRLISTAEGAKARVLHRANDVRWVYPCAWTPDGRNIVLYRERTGSVRELGLVSVATGEFRLLKTLPIGPQRATVSPDGRFLAYDTSLAGIDASRDVFIMGIDGTADTRLDPSSANDQMPMWTPDGSRVIFLSDRAGSNGLWSVPVAGGRPAGVAQMVKQDAGAFYPLGMTRSGSIVYFVGGDRFNSYVADFDVVRGMTASPAPLTDAFVNSNIGSSWSPDGQRVAFYVFRGRETQRAAIVVRTLATGAEREIPLNLLVPRGNSGPVRWFPDGRAVLIVTRDPQDEGFRYQRVDLAAGTVELVHRTKRRGPPSAGPVLSPDGAHIFYLDRSDAEPDILEIRRFDLATRADHLVAKVDALTIAISPDGRQLASVFRPEKNSRSTHVGVMTLPDGPQRVVARYEGWIDASRLNAVGWTRDGASILLGRREGEAEHVFWRIPVAGGAPQKIGLSTPWRLMHPEISPDGTKLLYSARDLSENAVWVLDNLLAPKSGSTP